MGRRETLRARCRNRCSTWWITCKCHRTLVDTCRTCAAGWRCRRLLVAVTWIGLFTWGRRRLMILKWLVDLCRWIRVQAPDHFHLDWFAYLRKDASHHSHVVCWPVPLEEDVGARPFSPGLVCLPVPLDVETHDERWQSAARRLTWSRSTSCSWYVRWRCLGWSIRITAYNQ